MVTLFLLLYIERNLVILENSKIKRMKLKNIKRDCIWNVYNFEQISSVYK